MIHQIVHKLLAYYSKDFFTEPILLMTFIFAFVVGSFYNYRAKERILFVLYFFAGVLLFLVASPMDAVLGRKAAVFNEICNTGFEIVEFTAFQYFFKNCFRNKGLRRISNVFLIILAIICTAFLTALPLQGYTEEMIREHSFLINVIEFLFLSFLCLAYFYELFTEPPKINLLERPSFFITTSVFFYSVLLIPFFVIARALLKEEPSIFSVLFPCHYLLLIIVLLSISKAFLCRKPITT